MDIAFPFFLLGVAVLAVVGAFVASLFLRYRFKGDRSLQIVGLFVILFVASVILTLSI